MMEIGVVNTADSSGDGADPEQVHVVSKPVLSYTEASEATTSVAAGHARLEAALESDLANGSLNMKPAELCASPDRSLSTPRRTRRHLTIARSCCIVQLQFGRRRQLRVDWLHRV